MPAYAAWHLLGLRSNALCQWRAASTHQGPERLVVVRPRRVDQADVLESGAAQPRGHADAGAAAADDQHLMPLRRGHQLSSNFSGAVPGICLVLVVLWSAGDVTSQRRATMVCPVCGPVSYTHMT